MVPHAVIAVGPIAKWAKSGDSSFRCDHRDARRLGCRVAWVGDLFYIANALVQKEMRGIMWSWIDAHVQLAIAAFTLLAALATFLAVWATSQGNARAIRRNTEMAAAKWIFDVYMRLNEDPRLSGIFYKFKYGEYSFNYEGPNVIDLNTSKERDLVYFLDFLNAVDAALRKHIITMRDLDDTTIGFTIRLANRCGPIGRFMTFIRRRDADLKLPVHAWGAMEQR